MFRFVLSAAAIAGILAAQPAFAEPSPTTTSGHTQSAERGKAIAYTAIAYNDDYNDDEESATSYRPGNNK
jgi:hypothetical protein